jgi:hypothetical protein
MKKLLSGRWLIGHVLVLIAVIILINLGLWQLRRLDQRRALNASILAGLEAPVTLLTGEDVDPLELKRCRDCHPQPSLSGAAGRAPGHAPADRRQ